MKLKLKLKIIALAAALAATGAANAATSAWSTGNGSLIVYAYNTATTGYYIRDLGVLLNDFLPNSIGAVAGDNPLAGTQTPEGGANVVFAADTTFQNWAGSATTILWGAAAGDSLNSLSAGVARLLYASDVNLAPTNGLITNAVGGALLGGTANAAPANGSVAFASGVGSTITNNGGVAGAGSPASSLTALGSAANLYYYTRTVQGTGSAATGAFETVFGNSLNLATLTLASDGSVTYNLDAAAPAAVPLPAAAWLLGAGLMGLGGMARRRKAAAQA